MFDSVRVKRSETLTKTLARVPHGTVGPEMKSPHERLYESHE